MSRWKAIALRLDELNHAQGVPTGQAASDERWAIHLQIHDLVGGCPSDVPYCNKSKTLAAWARGRTADLVRHRRSADLLETK